MKKLTPLIMVLWLASPSWGAEIRGSGGGGGGSGITAGSSFPGSPSTNQLFLITDDSAAGECDSDAGSAVTLCRYDGADWVAVNILAEADTIQAVVTRGAEVTSANSLVNAVCFGAGTNPLCIYEDGTLGSLIRPQTDANTRTYIWNGFTWCLYDIEGDACMLTVDPDAASPNAMYQFGSGYRPVGTIYFDAGSISVDGTNCTAPTEQALNSAEKTWAFSCGDSNSSIFSGKIRMPKSWDLSTVTFTLSLFHGTTETITFAGDFSAQCRGAGDAINSTYGTAVASDVSITTANLIAEATTAAVTPNGTCAAEDWLLWRYVVDAANFSANAANSKVLGVTIKYSKSSWSD